MKYKSPSQLRSTLIRVHKKDQAILKKASEHLQVSIAEVVSSLTAGTPGVLTEAKMEIKQTWACRECEHRLVVTIEPGEPMGKITQPIGFGAGCPKCGGTHFDVEFGEKVFIRRR